MTRDDAAAAVDALYPSWRDPYLGLVELCNRRVEQGVYSLQVSPADLVLIWEELYLHRTNDTPHKAPLVDEAGKEVTV